MSSADEPIVIIDYQDRWPTEFDAIGARVRDTLGSMATAIHHIGSTSVPGLAAKDIIDVQVTVASLDDRALTDGMVAAGFQARTITGDHLPPGMTLDPAELRKRYFHPEPDHRPANIHVREHGRFNQRYALLCRDYLRTHQGAAAAYGRIKQQLARIVGSDVEAYYDVKDPTFDLLMAGAEDWAETSGWTQPPTDA